MMQNRCNEANSKQERPEACIARLQARVDELEKKLKRQNELEQQLEESEQRVGEMPVIIQELQKKTEIQRKTAEESVAFLSSSALKFLTFSSDDDIFIFIGKSLAKFVSKAVIVIFSYDQSDNTSHIRFISGIVPYINNLVEDILGKSPEEFTIRLPAHFKNRYLSGKTLRLMEDGLRNAMADDWPPEKATQIEALLKIDRVYSMGMTRDGRLYGGLLIAAGSNTAPIDAKTVETFIYQAGIALHRKQIDNELEKAKIAAEESDRLKSAFLANMSHEVRTPLNGILGLTQVMLQMETLAPNIRNNMQMIVESGSSLLTLIEDIMDISKIEAGQMKVKNRAFALNGWLDQLHTLFMSHPLYLQKPSIELLYDSLDRNLTIMSDPDRLQQIFVNLIGNAIKFTEKGFVRFGCSVNDREITFYVRDSGIGIPEDATERIFDRFTQVDHDLTRKFNGSGLGLAICKGLVTLLGGRIWCESKPGNGANFSFAIPHCTASLPSDHHAAPKSNIANYDWSRYTLLIAEDDAINMTVIEAMLRRTKVNVLHAVSGIKAVEYALTHPLIDLVLMDVHLPEMSGLEATGRIRAMRPLLPVIAQTANAMSDDRERCLDAGCIDYISKPIDMGELLSKIAKYLPEKHGEE